MCCCDEFENGRESIFRKREKTYITAYSKDKEKSKRPATIYSSCIQHIRYYVKKRYYYKRLSGSFIANISVSVNLKN